MGMSFGCCGESLEVVWVEEGKYGDKIYSDIGSAWKSFGGDFDRVRKHSHEAGTITKSLSCTQPSQERHHHPPPPPLALDHHPGNS